MKKQLTCLIYALCSFYLTTLSKEKLAPKPLFAHGLADTLKQARHYKGVLFDGPFISFDFPDATRNFWRVNVAESALGQQNDIDRLASVILDRIMKNPKETFIGIGVSRGAATWLNFMGLCGAVTDGCIVPSFKEKYIKSSRSHKEDAWVDLVKTCELHAVKALVLESPPDSMATAGGTWHGLMPLAFWKYDPLGIQSRDFIQYIPKDLPILIIGTKDDHRVPCSSTLEVYRLLQETGHKNTHILVFESGNHARFVLGDHRASYRNVAQAFYKKYGLPYDKQAAKLGKEQFKKTQPDPKDIICKT